MDTVTMKLSRREAEMFLEMKCAHLREELRGVEIQLEAIRSGANVATNDAAIAAKPRRRVDRVKKSITKALVEDFLKTPGAKDGASISQIARGAGAPYVSVYRVLQDMKLSGEVNARGKKWSLNR